MVTCLMLDVDGVLIDGRPEDGLRWDHRLEADLGIAPAALGRDFFACAWHDVVTGKVALMTALANSLLKMRAPVTAEDLVTYWFAQDSRIMRPVLEDCRTARAAGLQIFLTTNQEPMRATYLMERLALKAEVDGMITSAQAGFQKPHPAFYAFAQRQTGMPPEDLLLVDDTPANVDGARNAGWKAVHWDKTQKLSDILLQYGSAP